MAGLNQLLASVPQSAQWALAVVGALYLGSKVMSYLRLVLNVFPLSGTSVRASSLLAIPSSPARIPLANDLRRAAP